jgi:hypothetical protein
VKGVAVMVRLGRLPLVFLALPCLALLFLAPTMLLPAVAHTSPGPIDQANRLLDQAQVLAGQNDGIDARLQELEGKVGETPPGSREAAAALPLLKRMARAADEALANEQALAADLDQATALDINPELGMYLEQQREISRLRAEYWTLQQEKAAKLTALYRGWDRMSAAERSGLRAEYEGLAARASDLRATMNGKQAASEKFYEMKALGGVLPEGANEPPPGSPAWQGYLWTALILALGVAAGVLAVALGGRRLVTGSGKPARPTVLGWCVLAFGLVPPLLMLLVGRQGSDLLPWIWAAGLAALIAGVGAVVKRDRHWPTWAGLVLGVPVSLFWALFALGHLFDGAA